MRSNWEEGVDLRAVILMNRVEAVFWSGDNTFGLVVECWSGRDERHGHRDIVDVILLEVRMLKNVGHVHGSIGHLGKRHFN